MAVDMLKHHETDRSLRTMSLSRGESRSRRPDLAVAALPLFQRLRDKLVAAEAARVRSRQSPALWSVPRLFFFHHRSRASESSPVGSASMSQPSRNSEPACRECKQPRNLHLKTPPELFALIADACSLLTASATVRHAARAVPGLHAAARSLETYSPTIQRLAAILDLPDDIVIRVIHPAEQFGLRVRCRGIAQLGELQRRLVTVLSSVSGKPADPGVWQTPEAIAASDWMVTGIDEEFTLPYHSYTLEAIRPDGSLPTGLTGVDHWLWEWQRLTDLPQIEGERILLLGPPVYPRIWQSPPGLSLVSAEVEVLHRYSAAEVQDWIAHHVGIANVRDDRASRGFRIAA